jgi:hypothetical protein
LIVIESVAFAVICTGGLALVFESATSMVKL